MLLLRAAEHLMLCKNCKIIQNIKSKLMLLMKIRHWHLWKMLSQQIQMIRLTKVQNRPLKKVVVSENDTPRMAR